MCVLCTVFMYVAFMVWCVCSVLCDFVCVVYKWYVCVMCMCGLYVSMCLVCVLYVSACVCGMYMC